MARSYDKGSAQDPEVRAADPVYGGGINPNITGGGGDDQLAALLRGLMERWQPRETVQEKLAGYKFAQDPVGWTNKLRSLPFSEWGPGGAFANRPQMSPEATLASQGNTAANQWAQLGAYQGIDPERLRQLNAAKARSYYGA